MNGIPIRQATAVLMVCGLLGCSNEQAPPYRTKNGAVVLPGSLVGEMLHPCSRDAPARGEATWVPPAADINEFEAVIAANLQARLKQDRLADLTGYPKFPEGFDRQYVGIIRDERKFIYGNFAAKEPSLGIDPTVHPIDGCDGGRGYFGVEFDPETKQFTHWAFSANGLPPK